MDNKTRQGMPIGLNSDSRLRPRLDYAPQFQARNEPKPVSRRDFLRYGATGLGAAILASAGISLRPETTNMGEEAELDAIIAKAEAEKAAREEKIRLEKEAHPVFYTMMDQNPAEFQIDDGKDITKMTDKQREEYLHEQDRMANYISLWQADPIFFRLGEEYADTYQINKATFMALLIWESALEEKLRHGIYENGEELVFRSPTGARGPGQITRWGLAQWNEDVENDKITRTGETKKYTLEEMDQYGPNMDVTAHLFSRAIKLFGTAYRSAVSYNAGEGFVGDLEDESLKARSYDWSMQQLIRERRAAARDSLPVAQARLDLDPENQDLKDERDYWQDRFFKYDQAHKHPKNIVQLARDLDKLFRQGLGIEYDQGLPAKRRQMFMAHINDEAGYGELSAKVFRMNGRYAVKTEAITAAQVIGLVQ
ncbi:MAG: transglycosylase SLT domain-containing protein [Nanoarchaeota archaeon]|nr:transglycosylase SLT domain-containing protein [Nanoarchaeota archaeon]